MLSKTNDECDSPQRAVIFLKLGLWNVRSCANNVKFKDIHRHPSVGGRPFLLSGANGNKDTLELLQGYRRLGHA